jgi:hypothetical protein
MIDNFDWWIELDGDADYFPNEQLAMEAALDWSVDCDGAVVIVGNFQDGPVREVWA